MTDPAAASAFCIRPATADDVPAIYRLIVELAEFEKLTDQLLAQQTQIAQLLFGPAAVAEALIATHDGQPVGYAFYYATCSTFLGQPGIHLEDIYVRPKLRGRGLGKALLARLAEIAVQRGCGRLEWAVLNWNQRAIAFYEGLGAEPLSAWTTYRLTGTALKTLAGS